MARLLYVEDEAWQIDDTLIPILEDEFHHSVRHCASIAEADKRLGSDLFDVVILDIMMDASRPIRFEDSAFNLLDRIRSGQYSAAGNSAHMPVIVASGVWDMVMTWKDGSRIRVADAMQRMGLTEDRCLHKPFQEDDLNALIARILAA